MSAQPGAGARVHRRRLTSWLRTLLVALGAAFAGGFQVPAVAAGAVSERER